MARITPDEARERLTPVVLRAQGTAKAVTTPFEYVRSIGVGEDSVYLFRKNKAGFIVPADSDLHPILGESEEADFTLDLPEPLAYWVDGYAQEIEWYQNIGCQLPMVEDTVTDAEETQDVAMLTKTKWAQEYPFNANIKFEGKRCLVGCGPLALGQVIYYWATKGYMRGCTATEEYTSTTNIYEVEALPPKTIFDYPNMTLTKPTTTAAINAISEMLSYCGRTVQADYKPTSTGAYEKDIVTAAKNNFRLGSPSLIYAGTLGLAKFCEKIRADLVKGQPVIVSGFNSSLSGGHCFVCDGYRSSDDKFHFNWGWFGRCNGWYKMNALTPAGSRNYSYRKNAIIGLCPAYKDGDLNGDGKINITDLVDMVSIKLKGEYDEKADVNYDGKVDDDDIQEEVSKIMGK